jgi:hypothetical protein
MGGVSSDDSEVIDLYAICARASARPAGDLRPPDLLSLAPPVTTDLPGEHTLNRIIPPQSRMKIALAGGAAFLLVLGVVVVSVSSASAQPAKATTAQQVPAAAELPLPAAAVEAPAPPPPEAAAKALPAPPTTGAPVVAKAPARTQPVAMRPRALTPTSAGPKMTKIQSTGVR